MEQEQPHRRLGRIPDLLFRAAVLAAAIVIAFKITDRPQVDTGAIFLVILMICTALGYSAQGIARLFGRD